MKNIISVNNISKTFIIPHEKKNTFRENIFSIFKPNTYEKFDALKDVSFDVKEGEFFGVIGRNGSGKSTLLKILANIYTPDKGKVHVKGKISPFLELGVGFNPELSAKKNVYLNGVLLGLTTKEIDKKFDEIIYFAELEKFVDTKLKNFSSGMHVRLAFSVAIQAVAEILLIDEVLAVGDSNLQSKCLDVFKRLKKEGRTIVFVSHGMEAVREFCDRVLLLEKGKVDDLGTAENMIRKYGLLNMSDEEERMNTDEKRNTEKEETDAKQSKIIEKPLKIQKVEFLDEKQKNRHIFDTNEDIIARIYYKATKKIAKPVFGVSVYTEEGVLISGPNTKTSNFIIEEIDNEGYIDFIINKNLLLNGTYYLTIGIFNWSCTLPYDYQDKKYSFKIQSTEVNQFGVIKLNSSWKM